MSETMRPASCLPVSGAPKFLVGIARVRGSPIPIVDLGLFLDGPAGEQARRWVTVRVDDRLIGIAVSRVEGVYYFDEARLGTVPPLLSVAPIDHVDAVAAADEGLFTVIRPARILSEELWARVHAPERTS